METGFINISIDLETKQLFISNKPYNSIEEAEAAVFIGSNIYKIGTFEINYPNANNNTSPKQGG